MISAVSVLASLVLLLPPSEEAANTDIESIFQNAEVTAYSPPLVVQSKTVRACRKAQRFYFSEDERVAENGAEVLFRCPPRYPERCFRRGARGSNAVELVYDVNEEGEPVNIRAIRTTDDCFNKSAARAVGGSRFARSATGFKDFKTTQIFILE